MKIFTNKQYQKLLDDFSHKIENANKEGFILGTTKAYMKD